MITSSAFANVREAGEPNQILTRWFPFLGMDLALRIFSLNLMVVIIVGLYNLVKLCIFLNKNKKICWLQLSLYLLSLENGGISK